MLSAVGQHAAVEAAVLRRIIIVRTYSIAGLSISLRFTSAALAEKLCPALDHHPPGQSSAPDLVVCIWDSASTGVPVPSVPNDALDGGKTGAARVAPTPAVRMKYRPDLQSLSMLDRRTNFAVFCMADVATLPYWETGSPLRTIFHWWMEDHGRQLVHAAALGTSAGGLLLVGRSGSGKSSTALACLGSRLGYAGDDYCLVSLDPAPRAHSLYSSAKLHPEQARRFPALAPALVNADKLGTEKALFLVQRSHPSCLQESVPVRAIVVPVISTGRSSRLERTSAGTALLALAPSTILQTLGAGQRALITMTRMVARVPSYILHLGHDLDAIPTELERALTGTGTP
jgi:hypothetical protein